MFDAHNHLQFAHFQNDRDDVIQRSIDAGITGFLLADFDFAMRDELLRLAGRSGFFATIGIHPWAVAQSKNLEKELTRFETDVERYRDQIVGIGELGIDELHTHKADQITVFRRQLDVARNLDVPLVLHAVKSHDELLGILKRDGVPKAGGMVHGFSGSADHAKKYRQFDIDISVGTTVTKANARKIVETILEVGIDHLMVETDAPSRPPEMVDRDRCEPSDLIYVIDAVANVLGISRDVVSQKTAQRVRDRFNLSDEVLK